MIVVIVKHDRVIKFKMIVVIFIHDRVTKSKPSFIE